MMVFLLAMLALSGCSIVGEGDTPLNPKGSVAQDQLWLIQLSIIIMMIVLIVVFALFFYIILRYTKRRGQTGVPKQVEGNHKLEITWTVIPIVLLIILAVPTVQQTFALAKDYSEHKDAIQVKVTAHQFWWEFEYKDYGIVTAQELVIPVDKKVYTELHSADVAHSFWIPGLAGKTDTLPGLVNTMYFDALEEGIYRGKCAELCGPSHAWMDFKVKAVSQEEFDAWVVAMQNPVVVDENSLGAQVFTDKSCIQCHAITPGGKSMGPNLNNFADRSTVFGIRPNEAEWIAKWIKDPLKEKPGSQMPQIPMSDEELDALVDYLLSLDNTQQ